MEKNKKVKVKKNQLKNLILKEIKRVTEGEMHMDPDDLMDYDKPCPQGWKDADCLQNKINDILKGALEGVGERYGLEPDQEQKLISDFMYDIEESILDLALETVGGSDDDQGEGYESDFTGIPGDPGNEGEV
jgi:hypothetical protein